MRSSVLSDSRVHPSGRENGSADRPTPKLGNFVHPERKGGDSSARVHGAVPSDLSPRPCDMEGPQSTALTAVDGSEEALIYGEQDENFADMSPLHLSFVRADLEHAFSSFYNRQSRAPVQNAIAISVVVWLLFMVNDIYKESQGQRDRFEWTISLRLVSTVYGICCYLVGVLAPENGPLNAALVWMMILVCGSCQVVFGVLEDDGLDPTYSGLILLLSSMTSTFFRLRFVQSVAVVWLLFVVYAVVVVSAGAENGDNDEYVLTLAVLVIGNLLFCAIAYKRERAVRQGFVASLRLRFSEARAAHLLRAMLPLSIIEELKQNTTFIHQLHKDVSVLFSHIHDFDNIAAELTAAQLVQLLNRLFSGFDALIDRKGVYKVETIGDVYMVSAGVPEFIADHASALCELALQMVQMVKKMEHDLHKGLSLQIGINSGPVVAGVVGQKYPRFRLMGDTVNTASRMSTTGCKPNTVQLSEACYRQASGFVKCRDRGEVPVKGKGDMRIYVLEARAEADKPVSATTSIDGDSARSEVSRSGPRRSITIRDQFFAESAAKILTQIKSPHNRPAFKRSQTLPALSSEDLRSQSAARVSRNQTTLVPSRRSGRRTSGMVSALVRPGGETLASPSIDDEEEDYRTDFVLDADWADSRQQRVRRVYPVSVDGVLNRYHLTFSEESGLEGRYQQHYFSQARSFNRVAIVAIACALSLLGIYDHVRYHDDGPQYEDIVLIMWALRACVFAMGLSLAAVSYCNWFGLSHMQLSTVIFLIVSTGTVIYGSARFDTLEKVWGVGLTLLMCALSSVAFGLRFVHTVVTMCGILTTYVVTSAVINERLPLVFFFLFAGNFLYCHSAYIQEFHSRENFIRLRAQQQEERRTTQLRDSMLPPVVIRQLTSRSSIAHEFEEASVLFCDIVQFTKLANAIRAQDLVAILNVIFSKFDQLTTKHDVYKVETIGDAYLACSGIVDSVEGHTQRLCDFALDMQQATRHFRSPDSKPIVVRVGIHTGFVIAGVVGQKMPRYHLFGATYTLAEAFESNGIPGRVVISESTYDKVSQHFKCVEAEGFESSGQHYKKWVLCHRTGVTAAQDEHWRLPPPHALASQLQ